MIWINKGLLAALDMKPPILGLLQDPVFNRSLVSEDGTHLIEVKKFVVKNSHQVILAHLKVQKHADGYDDANSKTKAENATHQAVQSECDYRAGTHSVILVSDL